MRIVTNNLNTLEIVGLFVVIRKHSRSQMENLISRNHYIISSRRLPFKNQTLTTILLLVTDLVVVVASRGNSNRCLLLTPGMARPVINKQSLFNTEQTARVITLQTELPVTNFSKMEISFPFSIEIGIEISRQSTPHSRRSLLPVQLSIQLHNL